MALEVKAGGQGQIKLKRVNIAERLYRITGAGIYRDSVLLGQPVPIKHPLMDGLVMGQDTVDGDPVPGQDLLVLRRHGAARLPARPVRDFGGDLAACRARAGWTPTGAWT